MKRTVLGLVLFLVASVGAFAQCKDTLRALSPKAIGLSLCPDTFVPKEGDTMVIEAAGSQIVTKVTSSANTLGTQVVNVEVADPAKAQENMLLLTGIDSATITLAGDAAVPAKPATVVVQQGLNTRNIFRYSWSLGPATKGDPNGGTGGSGGSGNAPVPGDTSGTGAIRLQYMGEYTSSGVFGGSKEGPLQTSATLAIDTTDQHSSEFVDNNKASLGLQLKNLSFGRLWMHGQFGVEGQIEKAFHQDVQNVDALVTASGWVPILRSLTLFSQNGDFIAAPLSFKASYGYRDRRQLGVTSRGRVFEGSALYHIFLLDQFQVSFSATLTHNDLNDQPASVPRTQRLYKATIAYLENPQSGFKVLTSIEDGSAGVMLRKVRQYFIGVAISKLNFGG
jgi:hypothetical protein